MKDTIKSPSIDTGIDITKMHGHMDIYLTDVKTGEVEEVHEDNMMTNALQEYFRNLGFLNYPNLNKENMVVDLLGGVMGFDEEISENASIIHVPAGHRMIFNGSVGTVNNGNPTEMGSYSSTESGWQNDGSYIQTYDFSTSQANGTISCVCLTGRNYGFFGEGNSKSLTRHATRVDIFNLIGSASTYSIPGMPFNVDYINSVVYTFTTEQVEEEVGSETVTVTKGVVSKYHVPLTKLNIKGTPSAPILLSKRYFALDDEFLAPEKLYQSHNGNLLCWNIQPMAGTTTTWGSGSWTQYVWTITTSGTISRQTVANTYGEDLYGLQAAHFDGNYCFFVSIGGGHIDSTKVYVWNRSTNAINVIDNAGGVSFESNRSWINDMSSFGWDIVHGSGDGRIVTCGECPFVCDAVLMEGYPANLQSRLHYHYTLDKNKLVWLDGTISGLNLIRDQSYIASINNLDTPVVKTAEKTMKVVYRITFDD